jgi:hypothetical protein
MLIYGILISSLRKLFLNYVLVSISKQGIRISAFTSLALKSSRDAFICKRELN